MFYNCSNSKAPDGETFLRRQAAQAPDPWCANHLSGVGTLGTRQVLAALGHLDELGLLGRGGLGSLALGGRGLGLRVLLLALALLHLAVNGREMRERPREKKKKTCWETRRKGE